MREKRASGRINVESLKNRVSRYLAARTLSADDCMITKLRSTLRSSLNVSREPSSATQAEESEAAENKQCVILRTNNDPQASSRCWHFCLPHHPPSRLE
jgi:hypothetical protein